MMGTFRELSRGQFADERRWGTHVEKRYRLNGPFFLFDVFNKFFSCENVEFSTLFSSCLTVVNSCSGAAASGSS